MGKKKFSDKRRQELNRQQLMLHVRTPKHHVHVAICLSYLGTAFRGLQLQTAEAQHQTLEGTFIEALKALTLVESTEGGKLDRTHQFTRSCRTDKGVHAVRNVVCLWIHEGKWASLGGPEAIKNKLNELLPGRPAGTVLRVEAVSRVLPSFVPKNVCNRRVYRYLLPLYSVLDHRCDSWADLFKRYPTLRKFLCRSASSETSSSANSLRRRRWKTVSNDSIDEASSSVLESVDIRCGEQQRSDAGDDADELEGEGWMGVLRAAVSRANNILHQFVGSRRFHNFTVDENYRGASCHASSLSPTDQEAVRIVYRCEVAPRLWLVPTEQILKCPTGEWLGPDAFSFSSNTEGQSSATTSGDDDAEKNNNKKREFMRSRLSGGKKKEQSEEVETEKDDDVRFLPFLIFQAEGASFLLHMIRKMVGTFLAVVRGARPGLLLDALSVKQKMVTPMAPGPFLTLAHSSYHGYDRTVLNGMSAAQAEVVEREGRDSAAAVRPLEEDWALKGAHDASEEFLRRRVYPEIAATDVGLLKSVDELLTVRDAQHHHNKQQQQQGALEQDQSEPRKRSAPPSAVGEMTVFLRSLRVHNWNTKPFYDTASEAKKRQMGKYILKEEEWAAEVERWKKQQQEEPREQVLGAEGGVLRAAVVGNLPFPPNKRNPWAEWCWGEDGVATNGDDSKNNDTDTDASVVVAAAEQAAAAAECDVDVNQQKGDDDDDEVGGGSSPSLLPGGRKRPRSEENEVDKPPVVISSPTATATETSFSDSIVNKASRHTLRRTVPRFETDGWLYVSASTAGFPITTSCGSSSPTSAAAALSVVCSDEERQEKEELLLMHAYHRRHSARGGGLLGETLKKGSAFGIDATAGTAPSAGD